MFKLEPKVSPVRAAVEHVTREDQWLEVGQVVTENTVHEMRCRVQHRDPATSDRLQTIEAVDELVVEGSLQWVDMFGVRCVRRIS